MAPALWRTLLVSLLLSTAAIALAVFWLGDPGDLLQLGRLSLPAVALGLLLLFVNLFAGGLRLYLLTRVAGEYLNVWRSTRAFILGLFGAAVTPSGGGNGPATAISLGRDGVSSSAAWSVTLYTSLLDLVFFAWALPAGALLLFWRGLLDPRLLLVAVLLAAACLVLWYGASRHLHRAQRLGGWIFSTPMLVRWRRRAVRFLAALGETTRTVNAANAPMHIALHLTSGLLHLSQYAIFHVFLVTLGGDSELLQTLAVMALVSITTHLVPTPGASGYLEFAMSYIFSRTSEAGTVAAAVVAYRALTFYASILLGAGLGGVVLAKELTVRGEG